MGAIVFTQ